MRIEGLKQNGDYELSFPVVINNVPLTQGGVSAVAFGIKQDKQVILSLTLEDNPDQVFIDGSNIVIKLKAVNTVTLDSAYGYELWVKSANSENYPVKTGDIIFTPTDIRI